MIKPATVALRGVRTNALVVPIIVRGIDLTDAVLSAMVLQNWDNDPAYPELEPVVTLGSVEDDGGVPVSNLTFSISLSDMEGVPAAAEVGEDVQWVWMLDIQTDAEDADTRQRYAEGPFYVGGSASGTGSVGTLSLTVADQSVSFSIDGASALGPLVASAQAAEALARDWASKESGEPDPVNYPGKLSAKQEADRSETEADRSEAERQAVTTLLIEQAGAFNPPTPGLPRLYSADDDMAAGRAGINVKSMMGITVPQIGGAVGEQFALPTYRLPARDKLVASAPILGSREATQLAEANHASGYSYLQLFVLETQFDQVELLYLNGTTSSKTIGPIKVATATSIADVLANWGNGLDWTEVEASLVLPAAASTSRPSCTLLDPEALESATRTDRPSRSILLVRTFYPPATTTQALIYEQSTVTASSWGAESTGRIMRTWRMAGDGVTDPTDWTSPTEVNRWPCAGVVARSTHAGAWTAPGMAIGDSLTYNPTGGPETGMIYRALRAATSDALPLSWIGAGWVGQNTTAYLARAQDLIPLLRPAFCVYSPWSPNDNATPDSSTYTTAIANAEAFLTLCEENLVLPVLWTSGPRDTYSLAEDNIRLRVNAWTRAQAPQVPVVDIDALWSDQARPARWTATYTGGDGLHASSVGQQLSERMFQPVFDRIVEGAFQRFRPAPTVGAFAPAYGGVAGLNTGVVAGAVPTYSPTFGGDARDNEGINL